jgi:acyl dehydratase
VPRVHWEDLAPGQVTEFGPRLVTREEIIAFAAEFDPQPMHLDEEAASASMLGGLAASGWHACCVLMRMIADGFLAHTSFMGAPGIEEVRWIAPLRPGARVKVRATVLETRASRSRPDMGFVKFRYELMDDKSGALLLALTVIPMFGRRAAAGTAREAGSQAQGRP